MRKKTSALHIHDVDTYNDDDRHDDYTILMVTHIMMMTYIMIMTHKVVTTHT